MHTNAAPHWIQTITKVSETVSDKKLCCLQLCKNVCLNPLWGIHSPYVSSELFIEFYSKSTSPKGRRFYFGFYLAKGPLFFTLYQGLFLSQEALTQVRCSSFPDQPFHSAGYLGDWWLQWKLLSHVFQWNHNLSCLVEEGLFLLTRLLLASIRAS